MKALEFIEKYLGYVEMIEDVVKPKFYGVIVEMRMKDPQDFISPETHFSSKNEAFGFVWNIFKRMAKEAKLI